MSDHEFEKQVHQKLEELKLRPSDTVWMEVEKNIRKDKRRRRLMWLWLPMLFICITTSGYILYRYTINSNNTPAAVAQAVPASLSNKTIAETSNTSTQQATTHTKPASENSLQTRENATEPLLSQPDSKLPAIITPEASKEPARTLSLSDKQQPSIAVTEKSTYTTKGTIGIHNKKPAKKTHTGNDHSAGEAESAGNNRYIHKKHLTSKKKAAQDVIEDKEAVVKEAPVVPAADTHVTAADQAGREFMVNTMPAMVKDADDSIATNKAVPLPFSQPLLLAPDSANNRTAAAIPIQRKRSSLWHWGIVTDAGYSRISESKLFQLRGLLGKDKYLAEDLAANSSPTRDANSLLNFSSVAATPPKKASPIQPDFSFSAGFFVQRTLSNRFKLSLGLEYNYMSVNTQVGAKVSAPIVVNVGTSMATLAPEYYKNAGYGDAQGISTGAYQPYFSQKYRYRFQYIEIPLMAHWQINKGRRLPPVVFDGGVSFARLLSVDALHYDGIKGVYYQDNSLINKSQFNFVSGVSVGLFQRSKYPIWIGPNLRYALNGLVKNEISSGQYLWSAGLSIKMLLGRL